MLRASYSKWAQGAYARKQLNRLVGENMNVRDAERFVASKRFGVIMSYAGEGLVNKKAEIKKPSLFSKAISHITKAFTPRRNR